MADVSIARQQTLTSFALAAANQAPRRGQKEKISAKWHPARGRQTISKVVRHMHDRHLTELEKVGLSTAEAQIYLALVRNGSALSASAIVAVTGVPRSSVYPTLTRLTDLGFVEAEAGYGGRFTAVSPDRALASLMLREREHLSEREQVAEELGGELKDLVAAGGVGIDAEQIQVIRDPRVASERFKQLQLEARHQIDVFVKAPFFQSTAAGNPTQDDMAQRGVRGRGLYEKTIIEDPNVTPHLRRWVTRGEEVRVYDGELPHKLAIFDHQNILLPLVSRDGTIRTLFIRHPQLAKSLGMFFDYLWREAEPLDLSSPSKPRRKFRPRDEATLSGDSEPSHGRTKAAKKMRSDRSRSNHE
jgi:sugar-specific transcriptional regulator TrmB